MSDDLNYLYDNERREMLKYVPQTAESILEVGCGTGKFAALLKKRQTCKIWAIEQDATAARIAAKHVDKIVNVALEEAYPEFSGKKFDVILFLDVLEHLAYPEQALQKMKNFLSPTGVIVASIPNLRYFYVFRDLVWYGRFDYAESGILDRTHLRFFTHSSIHTLFNNSAYKIETLEGINPVLSPKLKLLNLITFNRFWDARYLQFACVAKASAETPK